MQDVDIAEIEGKKIILTGHGKNHRRTTEKFDDIDIFSTDAPIAYIDINNEEGRTRTTINFEGLVVCKEHEITERHAMDSSGKKIVCR
jgi:hypothetical protein